MMSMMPGQGMGAAGTGVGSGPQMPGVQGLSPQLLAMLQQMQGGQGSGMPGQMQPPPGPMQMPTTGTPMAGYIGAGGNPGMMHPTMTPPVGAPPGQPPGPGQPPAAGMAGAMNPQMMQLLMQMKGQQSGVPAAAPPQLPDAQNPMGGVPNQNMWQQLLARMQGQPNIPQTGAGGAT